MSQTPYVKVNCQLSFHLSEIDKRKNVYSVAKHKRPKQITKKIKDLNKYQVKVKGRKVHFSPIFYFRGNRIMHQVSLEAHSNVAEVNR